MTKQQTASEIAAERDRLRAALEAARPFLNYAHTHDRARMTATECAACDDAVRLVNSALANTSPAPVESVNAELLNALRRIAESEPRPHRQGRYDASVHQDMQRTARATIARAEKAGG